jgi:predicted Rossmann fold nucleotide-binding protein DprA/Smf involved in DNA uptake
MFSDDAKAVIALATRLGDSKRPSLSPSRWHRFASLLDDAGHSPADVFDAAFVPTALPGMREDIAASISELISTASAATVAATDLMQMGIWTITIADDDYPGCLRQRLAANSPPALFGVGNRSLLTGTAVGIVGSRNVTAEGAEAARALARATVSLGRALVSGGARGVDQLSMNAAYEEAGSVIGVLADSLQARIRNSDVLRALDDGDTCLVSQQIPSAGFTPASAMARNKLIYALSDLTVVVASDLDSGGTWSGAVEALNRGVSRVVVWRGAGEGPGNEALERSGASPLRSAGELSALFAAERPSAPEQLSLADTP